MSEEADRIIHECFTNGRVGLDCDTCEVHPYNAEDPEDHCCYGTDHEQGHESCNECNYESDCSRLTHGTSRTTKKKRRIIRRASSRPVRQRSARHDEEPEGLIQLPSRRPSIHRTSEEEVPEEQEERFMKRLGRVTGWGMIEGGLQMALNFFQKNRPE